MDRQTIDTWLERTMLALVLGLLGFGTLALGAVRPSEFIVLWWLVAGVLGLWVVRIWVAPKFRFLWPPVCWAMLPFVGYALWRHQTADIEFIARQELIQIILAALLLAAVVNNLHSQESTRVISFFLVALALAVSMYGIFQWLKHSEQVWWFPRPAAYWDRASGSFICPNHLAGFLEMILPIAVALTVTGRVPVVTRIGLAYASLVILAGVAATQSRGGWLATGVAMLMLFLFLVREKGQRWIALGLLAVVLGTGGWLYSRSISHRVTSTYVSGHERDIRLRLWVSAAQMWQDHPWWGVGADHFDYRFRQYREAVDKTQARPGRAHNDFINTLADYGVVGLLLVLLPVGVGAWSVFRCWRYVQRGGGDFGEKKSNRAAIVLGAAAGLTALLVHSFFDFNMHIPANAFLAVTLLAVIAGHIRFATERYWITARWPVALAGTLALAGCLYYLGPQGLTRTREVTALRRAEKLTDGTPGKIAALQAAFALEPKNSETALALGEQLRGLAWIGGDDYEARTREALVWYERAVALNRWDVNALLGGGMCLDWLGRHEEATPYFVRALELDPNYYYSRAMMGWHYVQMENYERAQQWLEKSLQVNFMSNPLARVYLELAVKRQAEQKSRAVRPPP